MVRRVMWGSIYSELLMCDLLHRVIKLLSSIVLQTVSLNCRKSSKEQEYARSGHSNICLVFSDETPQSHVVSPS